MKATLSNYRQSPRKVQLVADLVRGKSVEAARRALAFLPKKSSPDILKLLESAVANARSKGTNPEELVVKTITVNKGAVLRRFMPKARGRAASFRRTMSIISLELGTKVSKQVSAAKTPKAVIKTRAPRAKKKAE